MKKEIEKRDMPEIHRLIKDVLHADGCAGVERMGGLTNHTYAVTLEGGEKYVVRIPGEGTENMIVRKDEKVSTELACALGIDAELLYFGEDGAKVTRYIDGAVTMSAATMREERGIKEAAAIFRRLHLCGVDTHVPFDVFEMASNYEKIISDMNVPMFDDYGEIGARVMAIKSQVDASVEIKKSPCHNDPLCENWVRGNGGMYLIDWEYAGMNDGMWDLADISIEAGYGDREDALLLREYFGKAPGRGDLEHFLASKIYVDYLWTLWAKTRVPYDGQPMEDWAAERYARLRQNIARFDALGENGGFRI